MSSPPSAPPRTATEGKLSVADYHALQQQKRGAGSGTDKPKSVLVGSSVISTDGSMPLDYEESEEGEVMEDEMISSSERKDSESSADDAGEQHAGSRRPREDQSSASSSKRSRGEDETALSTAGALSSPRTEPAVRDIWMPSASEIASNFGATVAPNPVALYSCNAIVDDVVVQKVDFDSLTNQRRDYYIGLFHELRYYGSKKTSRKSKVPEWQALCQSWNAFVDNFNKDPAGYRARVEQARERFGKFSKRGKLERLHVGARLVGIPCAVPSGVACPFCYPGAERPSDRDVNGYTTIRVPESIEELRADFIARDAPSTVADYSAVASFTPATRGGLRTPSLFPERPPAGRSEVPMCNGATLACAVAWKRLCERGRPIFSGVIHIVEVIHSSGVEHTKFEEVLSTRGVLSKQSRLVLTEAKTALKAVDQMRATHLLADQFRQEFSMQIVTSS